MGVTRDDGYLIGCIESQVCIYEYYDVCNGLRQWKGWRKEGPGMGVGVEDDGQKGRRFLCSLISICSSGSVDLILYHC
jgi:hypothetical protein